jgi:hypothetical protein
MELSPPTKQAPPPAHYQSYHYTTANHPQCPPAPQITYPPPALQITYPPSAPQITYLGPSNNPQIKNEVNPPPQPPPQNQEPPQQSEAFPTHDTILTITGGSNTDFNSKRQHRYYYREVNHVAVEGPITQTRWSHIHITFSAQDINLTSFSHTDAMVLTVHIDRWDVLKILVNNGSQAKILFLSTFKKMSYDKKQLKEPTKPLYEFGDKRIEPVGVITLPVSFGTPKNSRIEYITFDIIDMMYPYNAIFGRVLLNTFEVVLHSTYLCLKVPGTFSIITAFGSQKEARNIERGFAPGHKNVHFLREDTNQLE